MWMGCMPGCSLPATGSRIEAPPRDAEWGERFFHLTDPEGHGLSFAWRSSAAGLRELLR
jgi:uncharacterized glyoxalase superfamily protein PhnB